MGDGFINGVSGIVNRGCHNVSTDEILYCQEQEYATNNMVPNVAHMPLSQLFVCSLLVAQVPWMEALTELRTLRRCLK